MKGEKKGTKKQVRKSEINEKNLRQDIEDSLLEQIISFGIESYLTIVEDEITEICGERYKHRTNREFTRWSNTETPLILGGRKISIHHSRIRNIKNNTERGIETINQYKNRELLSRRQMEQMIIGVSTRKYKRSLETDTEGAKTYSDSKSTVSRNFIAMTKAKLDIWMNQPITEVYPILMIDGIMYAETTVLVAMGIDTTGKKKALGAWEGSTENSRVCTDLLQSLIERGLKPSDIKLAIIDGSKALRKALNDVFGSDILIQRCQVHKKKNVTEYLPKGKRDSIKRAMTEAYNAEDYDTAKKLLMNIKNSLLDKYSQAARSLEEGLEETLTLHKLFAHKEIRKSLCTTNSIESLNSGIRHVTRRVKRWRNSDMVMRWVCGAILESEKNFRRINGYVHMDALLKNIENFGKKVLEENKRIA